MKVRINASQGRGGSEYSSVRLPVAVHVNYVICRIRLDYPEYSCLLLIANRRFQGETGIWGGVSFISKR